MQARFSVTMLWAAGMLVATPIAAERALPFQLSDTLRQDSVVQSSKQPHLGATRGLATEVITVTSLDDVKLDAVGILPASVAGLPSDFWGDGNSARIAARLKPHNTFALPAVTALKHHILLAELSVPLGHSADGDMLLARLDHLLEAGALDQAEALLGRAGTPNAALFRRWFDVSLLTGRAERACRAMLGDAGLTPTLQARVFCLFRAGDWAAAALTLRSAGSLGKVSPDEEHLLSMFLDPEMFAGDENPPIPRDLTPLIFTMREALALPRSGRPLPLAFLQGDLQNYAGWRNRLMAAERLVRAQSIPPTQLIEAYNEARASASGGVWDRVRAVQDLRAALAAKDADKISQTLPVAYRRLAKVGLDYVLTEMVFPAIGKMHLSPAAQNIHFKLALLRRDTRPMATHLASKAPLDHFLVALATGKNTKIHARSDIQLAISAAFDGPPLQHPLIRDAVNGRTGSAVLEAMNMLDDSHLNDPFAVEVGLSVLVQAGLREEAINIALQILILNRRNLI